MRVGSLVLRRISCLLLLAGCSAPFRSTISFTGPEIEQKIAHRFPIEKRAIIAAVKLDHPRVLFDERSDRIGVELDAIATVLGEDHLGIASVLGHLRYEPQTGEFFLTNPELVRLDIPDLRDEHREAVRIAASAVVAATLPQIPVHRIEDPSHKAWIKSVEVRNQAVQVELGI
jgi:uncharacterized protein DUF1439